MLSKEDAEKTETELAEECRKALEKEYGFKIPLPKSMKRSHFHQKLPEF